MSFKLYKGLKKPLVFFGLKDKYIYYALGIVAGGFILIAILNSFIGIIGALIGAGALGGGVWWVFKTQDSKGLYSKTKTQNVIFIIPKRFKNRKLLNHAKKERI